MTPDDVTAIAALAAAATDGPWLTETPEQVYGPGNGDNWADTLFVTDRASVADDDPPWLGPMPSADAEFIAAARDAVPALVAEVERLRVEMWTCPDCAFAFAAEHTDPDGGYSCPVCAEARVLALCAEWEREEPRTHYRGDVAAAVVRAALDGEAR